MRPPRDRLTWRVQRYITMQVMDATDDELRRIVQDCDAVGRGPWWSEQRLAEVVRVFAEQEMKRRENEAPR